MQGQQIFLHKKKGEAREAAGIESSTRNLPVLGKGGDRYKNTPEGERDKEVAGSEGKLVLG